MFTICYGKEKDFGSYYSSLEGRNDEIDPE